MIKRIYLQDLYPNVRLAPIRRASHFSFSGAGGLRGAFPSISRLAEAHLRSLRTGGREEGNKEQGKLCVMANKEGRDAAEEACAAESCAHPD